MSDLLIRNIPPALKARMASEAKASGRSLSDVAKEKLGLAFGSDRRRKAGSAPNAWEELRSIFLAHDAIDDEFAELLLEIEKERKSDFGRPAPEFE